MKDDRLPYPCGCGGLLWCPANGIYGPSETGWCLQFGEECGHPLYENVAYCPWCGKKVRGLPPREEVD